MKQKHVPYLRNEAQEYFNRLCFTECVSDLTHIKSKQHYTHEWNNDLLKQYTMVLSSQATLGSR